MPPSGTEFGGGVFGRGLGLEEVAWVGPRDGICALLRRDTRDLSPRHREKVAVHMPGGGPAPGTCRAGTMSSGFQPPELRENTPPMLTSHKPAYFAQAAPADEMHPDHLTLCQWLSSVPGEIKVIRQVI